MKAIIVPNYGSPDVLELKDVDKPTPGDDEVLVKIHAAAVNPLDYHGIRGGVIRLFGGGFSKPKDPGLGADGAGEAEAVGKNVSKFKPGDQVFGTCNGAFAEYATAREKNLVSKPAGVSFEQAAAAPVAATTALQGLRDKGKIHAGSRVLVNGASGGVGSFAVQIAKSYDTEVTGVCSTRNLDLVRSIKADHVVDYTKEDFTKNKDSYDLIYDAVGNRSVSEYKRALKPEGICVIAGFTNFRRLIGHMIFGPLVSTGSKKVVFMGIAKITQDDLLAIKELLESGKIKSVIDKRYPLSETAEAVRYLEQKHARGKVIIDVEQNP